MRGSQRLQPGFAGLLALRIRPWHIGRGVCGSGGMGGMGGGRVQVQAQIPINRSVDVAPSLCVINTGVTHG